MPLTHIAMGKAIWNQQSAIIKSVEIALTEAFEASLSKQLMIICALESGQLLYQGINNDNLLVIQINAMNTRTAEQKKQLYARLIALLTTEAKIEAKNIFINLMEAPKENWCFGH